MATIIGDDLDNVLEGTNDMDSIFGNGENDTLLGRGGQDFLTGGLSDDHMDGGGGDNDFAVYTDALGPVNVNLRTGMATGERGTDTLVRIENLDGGFFDDVLRGDFRANFINGNAGDDSIFGDGGDDFLFGSDGDDVIEGGKGVNFLDGGDGSDTLSYNMLGEGVTVDLASGVVTGATFTDTFTSFENIRGSRLADTLYGDDAGNRIDGGLGNDMIAGGGGNDVLIGGRGADSLAGNSGADRYVYLSTLESTLSAADTIEDFFRSEGDKIDLHRIDADTGTAGDQAFTFIGTAAFSAAGQLRYVDLGGGGFRVEGSTNADAFPELVINIAATDSTLAAGDFLL
jgi:Ca2+-binding RTX toxin-like protein